jgi:hypothetical protein
MKQAGVLMLYVHELKTHVHGYHIYTRTDDPVPWLTVAWALEIPQTAAGRQSTIGREMQATPTRSGPRLSLAIEIIKAQTTWLVCSSTLCDVDQSSHESFVARAWLV